MPTIDPSAIEDFTNGWSLDESEIRRALRRLYLAALLSKMFRAIEHLDDAQPNQ